MVSKSSPFEVLEIQRYSIKYTTLQHLSFPIGFVILKHKIPRMLTYLPRDAQSLGEISGKIGMTLVTILFVTF
jgi:hypothetical protein